MRITLVFMISVSLITTSCVGGISSAAKVIRGANKASKIRRGSEYIGMTAEQIAKRKLYRDRALAGKAVNKMTKKEDDKKHKK